MSPATVAPPKPRAEAIRSDLTRLPALTWWRRAFRRGLSWLARFGLKLLTRLEVRGLENLPRRGPALVVVNHLGDADVVVALAYFPTEIVEALAKAELYDYPLLGKVMDLYGVIWVHRGLPDRRALRAALEGLKQGRIVAVAPEARESVTGSLEEGTGGAAFIALKSGAPIVPVTFTGTENARVYGGLKRLRRSSLTMTVGPAFRLDLDSTRRDAVEIGTQQIMLALAGQLPPAYRGVYQTAVENRDGSG